MSKEEMLMLIVGLIAGFGVGTQLGLLGIVFIEAEFFFKKK